MRLFTGCIVAALLAGSATGAKADTDYRCLGDCMHTAGQMYAACEPQCTYGVTQPEDKFTDPSADQIEAMAYIHSTAAPLSTPVPTTDIVLPPSYAGAASIGKDFACSAECQHRHYEYQLCDEQCATIDGRRTKKFWELELPNS